MSQVNSNPKLLLVDDDSAFRSVYVNLLESNGYSVDQADDRDSARTRFATSDYAVVLLDLMLPPDGTPQGGVEQLRQFLSQRPSTKIVVVSGAGDTRAMLDAINDGAYDFITKPADPSVLLTVVARAVQRHALEHQIADLTRSLRESRPGDAIVGDSPRLVAALEMARRVAATALPVLILGENGTGKELFARYVHDHSHRRCGRFVAVNCGAIPETLYESTLFGHKKGAFTGAANDHAGLFGEANGGTLFLDEIGDMPAAMQVKLLRALEAGEILPVGATAPVKVDIRFVSATNQNLQEMQRSGDFREDLYWRIKGAEVMLPALRERPTDIDILAAHFLNQAAALARNGQPKILSDAAKETLRAHAWPGNLRELRHEMQRVSVLIGNRMEIEAEDLSFSRRAGAESVDGDTLQDKIEALERREIEMALAKYHGNRTHAAAALGLSRQGLLKKMSRYGYS